MKRIIELRKQYKNFMFDHHKTKVGVDYTVSVIVTIISAFLFAYGFRAFIAPDYLVDGVQAQPLISGGASGLGQILVKLFYDICDFTAINKITLQSIFFFLINIPLFFLAFFKIGKRFALITILNVSLVSLFIELLPTSMLTVFNIGDDILARALFAGLLTGFSTTLAFLIGSSAGGVDVISMYIGQKKSSSLGKYAMMFNASIVIIYVSIDFFTGQNNLTMMLYTLVYFFTGSKVLDVLYSRNKKVELQIFTTNDELGPALIKSFPHACTAVKGTGVFSGNERKILYMVVSHGEVHRAIECIKKLDAQSFITVVNCQQVYGKFYINPIK